MDNYCHVFSLVYTRIFDQLKFSDLTRALLAVIPDMYWTMSPLGLEVIGVPPSPGTYMGCVLEKTIVFTEWGTSIGQSTEKTKKVCALQPQISMNV